MDKKISVSSDQLDTLTTEQRADKFAQVADDDGDGDGGDDDDDDDDGDDGDGDGGGDVQLDTTTTEQRDDMSAQVPHQMIPSIKYEVLSIK